MRTLYIHPGSIGKYKDGGEVMAFFLTKGEFIPAPDDANLGDPIMRKEKQVGVWISIGPNLTFTKGGRVVQQRRARAATA